MYSFFYKFRIFLSLIETAGLTNLLKQEGSYTIFAPTDDAFDNLSKEELALLKSGYSSQMKTHPHTFVYSLRYTQICNLCFSFCCHRQVI